MDGDSDCDDAWVRDLREKRTQERFNKEARAGNRQCREEGLMPEDEIDLGANEEVVADESIIEETAEKRKVNAKDLIKIAKKKRSFDVETKLAIVAFAEKTDKSKAADRYGVHRPNVVKWCKQKEELKKLRDEKGNLGSKRLAGGGRRLKDADFDKELADWVREMRSKKRRVTRQVLQRQARLMWKESEKFTASEGWLTNFFKRHNFSTRRPTTVCQKEPKEYEKVLIDYILYLEKLRIKKQYESIFSCDETGIFLDQSNSLTINERGAREIPVLTTGHDKMRISVMLTARDDGIKCKPSVLLNRVRPVQKIIDKFRGKFELHWGGSTWMNETSISAYLQKIIGAPMFGNRLIVWDNFVAHKSEATKKKLKELRIDSILVPGGCTKFIQAPDVVWNQPFKAKIRAQYEDWMMSEARPATKGGNPAPPPMETYLEWVWNAWNELPKELIRRSFKSCAITTSTDGSEDHLIHCFKKEGSIPDGAKRLAEARAEQAQNEVNNHLADLDLNENDYDSDDSIDVVT